MKKLTLLLIAALTIIGLAGCTESPFEESDARAKEKGFAYRIDYRMYEITPKMMKEKLTLKDIQQKGDLLYPWTFYTNEYVIHENRLFIGGEHIIASPYDYSLYNNNSGDSVVIIGNETTTRHESWRFGKWKETKVTAWNANGVVLERETSYYIGLYRIKRLK